MKTQASEKMVSKETEILQLSSNRCKNERMVCTTLNQHGATATGLYMGIGEDALLGSQTQSITFMDPSLYKAAAEGEFNTLKQQVNIKNESPLHIAARHGDAAVVDLLIQTAKADSHKDPESTLESVRQMLRMTSKRNDTALHEAVRNNHLGVVQLLIKEDPDFSYPANHAGETPLYLAAEREDRDLVFVILRTCTSPAHGGPVGRTALHAAVICRDEEMTREILVHDVKRTLTKEADQRGWIPLHYAAFHDHVSILKLLLEFDRSAAYIPGKKENKTALHVSAGQGHIGIMKELLSSCPDCCELVDHRGKNALQFSMESRHPEAVKLVLNDSTFSYLLNEQAARGNASLHLFTDDHLHHPRVDLVDFDAQNRSALDVNVANAKVMAPEKSHTKRTRKTSSEDVGLDAVNTLLEGKGSLSMKDKFFKETRDAHLLVSILVATVTFTAGMTIPGGLVTDKDRDQGSAILAKSKAFQPFVVTDTIALALSSSAVFFHIFRSLSLSDLQSDFPEMWLLTFCAMLSMIVAFITGTYAVLQLSSGLAVANTVIGCLFLPSFYILAFWVDLADW